MSRNSKKHAYVAHYLESYRNSRERKKTQSTLGRRGNVWNLRFFLNSCEFDDLPLFIVSEEGVSKSVHENSKNKDTLLFVRLGREYTLLYYTCISKGITLLRNETMQGGSALWSRRGGALDRANN